MSITAMKQALEALELEALACRYEKEPTPEHIAEAIAALRQAIAEAEKQEPDAYGYAKRLAVAIWKQHYKATAPHWKPFDDLMGVLTQIDNMTSGLTARQEKQEPVAWDTTDQPFNDWWDADYDDSTNPFDKESPAYWAWAGWQAALNTKREWVGLTDEEILKVARDHYNPHQRPEISFARAIEAKLKERNT
jgi:hypothetical protein